MSLRHHTSGAARPWQFRPSDTARDALLRRHIHGPIQPMKPERGFFARLFGR